MMICADIILLLLIFIVSTESAMHWAVKVDEGVETAKKIAQENGFNFIGQVGELDNVFHFTASKSGYTRSVRQRMKSLQSHNQIGFFLRQKVKFHEKKEYTIPTDPLWKHQWPLYGNSDDTNNNNVQRAWLQGVSGEGVSIGVVDDGLEYNHPDLSMNYAKDLSFDFINRDADPRPRYSLYSTNTHGTKCAGIIGMAKDNDKCGVGVAFNSKIAGLRLLTDHGTTDIQESTALNYKYDEIDIYSNSWGPSDTGFTVSGPGLLTKMALENGITKGRQGKGSLFVWAAGNGGLRGDSCAADGYVNSIYTITVGSADRIGQAAYFDEQCSSKLIVAFSHDSQRGVHMSTTTGQTGCMNSFTGTSAATPLVSGVIALSLEANPNLTWRDIQYLLIYTANSDVLMTADNTALWFTNGAGLNVSPQFGFGAIDAEAMVTRATDWVTVPEQMITNVTPAHSSGISTNTSSHSISWEMNSILENVNDSAHYTNITFMEHVIVKITLTLSYNDPSYSYDKYYNAFYSNYELDDILSHEYARRGDISVSLKSPRGTVSKLLPKRKHDFINTQGYDDWEFMSVHYWGENPLGNWELLTSYESEVGSVIVSDISIKFYGTESVPQSVQDTLTQCNIDDCNNRCSQRNGKEICDTCKNKRDSKTLNCLKECPANYTEINGYCIGPNTFYNASNTSGSSQSTTTTTTNIYGQQDHTASLTPSSAYNIIHSTSTVSSPSSSFIPNIKPSTTSIVEYINEDHKSSAPMLYNYHLLMFFLIVILQLILLQ